MVQQTLVRGRKGQATVLDVVLHQVFHQRDARVRANISQPAPAASAGS